MRFKYYIVGLLLFMLNSPLVGMCAVIDWKAYPEGIAQAQQENKKIFLHFKSNRCPYCVKMEQLTFTDSQIIEYLNKHFVSIRVNGDRDWQLAKNYNVTGYPDSRFLNGERDPVFNFVGFQGPRPFMIFLEYVRTESYQTMDLMQFYESRLKIEN